MRLPIERAIVNTEAPWSRQVQCKSPQKMLERLQTFCTSATLMEFFCCLHERLHFFTLIPWICKCPRTMPPPKPPVKGTSSPTSVGTPTPGTPLSSPGTPHPDAETSEPAKKKPRKTAQEQVPLTPLQKARDMCQKLLKKKSDASNLGLTLQSIPFAGALSTEMNNYAKKFELPGSL